MGSALGGLSAIAGAGMMVPGVGPWAAAIFAILQVAIFIKDHLKDISKFLNDHFGWMWGPDKGRNAGAPPPPPPGQNNPANMAYYNRKKEVVDFINKHLPFGKRTAANIVEGAVDIIRTADPTTGGVWSSRRGVLKNAGKLVNLNSYGNLKIDRMQHDSPRVRQQFGDALSASQAAITKKYGKGVGFIVTGAYDPKGVIHVAKQHRWGTAVDVGKTYGKPISDFDTIFASNGITRTNKKGDPMHLEYTKNTPSRGVTGTGAAPVQHNTYNINNSSAPSGGNSGDPTGHKALMMSMVQHNIGVGSC